MSRSPLVALPLLAVALIVLPAIASDYVMLIAYRMLEAAALAQAFNLIAGYGGLVSLGNAAFIGLGAYATATANTKGGLGLLPAFALAPIVAGLFAVVVSPALFRLRGLYYTIATLSLSEALRIWMVNWNGLGGATGLFLQAKSPSLTEMYFLALAVMLIATTVVAWILRTRLGIALRAVRDDESSAQQMGLSVFRTKLWAFTLSAMLMGLVGGLHAAKLSAIEPYGAFTIHWTVDLVNITIIGGMSTLFGPLIGAVFIVGLSELLAGYPELHVAITGVILIATIRIAPQGIWGLVRPRLFPLSSDERVPSLRGER